MTPFLFHIRTRGQNLLNCLYVNLLHAYYEEHFPTFLKLLRRDVSTISNYYLLLWVRFTHQYYQTAHDNEMRNCAHVNKHHI
jgi:hypothetical protein